MSSIKIDFLQNSIPIFPHRVNPLKSTCISGVLTHSLYRDPSSLPHIQPPSAAWVLFLCACSSRNLPSPTPPPRGLISMWAESWNRRFNAEISIHQIIRKITPYQYVGCNRSKGTRTWDLFVALTVPKAGIRVSADVSAAQAFQTSAW